MALYDRIALLDRTKTTWRIRVRVSRMWLSFANNGDIFQGSNLILLDEENHQIHAFVKADIWNILGNDIVEGNVYVVSHFIVTIATGRLRPIHSDMSIMFTNCTIVQPVITDNFIIPMYKFNFSELGDLRDIFSTYEEYRSPLYSIDVIGVVQDLQHPKMVQTIYGGKLLVRFTITDGRSSAKVNVWDEHITSIDKLFQHGLQFPVIVILASTRLCKFEGTIEVATIPSTKIYINEQNEHFLFFRQRIQREGFQPQGHLA